MAGADQRPGRRRAVPEQRFRRPHLPLRPQAPARGHDLETPEPATPPTPHEPRRWLRRLGRLLWLVLAAAGVAATITPWTPFDVPELVPLVGAVTVTTTFAFGLSARTGGRPVFSGLLALALSAAAIWTDSPVLLAAAAVNTAVIAAVLGVMATKPAARFPAVVREVLVGVGVAACAAFAVDAYEAQVSVERAGYLVLGLSLIGALLLAYRLAAGLHGLGRRGLVMLVSGLGLLAVSLAYTEALARWGSPEVVDTFDGMTNGIRDAIGAVPRPTEFLLGIPALAWGVSTRARRRQGWWGTGFGAAGLATVTVSLLDHRVSLLEAGLATAYSVAVGLVLGYLVIRADKFLSGARGRRARRMEEAAAHRPEPGRMHALM